MNINEFYYLQNKDHWNIEDQRYAISLWSLILGEKSKVESPMDNNQGYENNLRAALYKEKLNYARALMKKNTDRLNFLQELGTALKNAQPKNFEDSHNLNVYAGIIEQAQKSLKARHNDIVYDIGQAEKLLEEIFDKFNKYALNKEKYVPENFGALQGHYLSLIKDIEQEADGNELPWAEVQTKLDDVYNFLKNKFGDLASEEETDLADDSSSIDKFTTCERSLRNQRLDVEDMEEVSKDQSKAKAKEEKQLLEKLNTYLAFLKANLKNAETHKEHALSAFKSQERGEGYLLFPAGFDATRRFLDEALACLKTNENVLDEAQGIAEKIDSMLSSGDGQPNA